MRVAEAIFLIGGERAAVSVRDGLWRANIEGPLSHRGVEKKTFSPANVTFFLLQTS